MKGQCLIALLLLIVGEALSYAGFVLKNPERLVPGENASVCVVSNDIRSPYDLFYTLMSADPTNEGGAYAEARASLSSRGTGCATLTLPKGVRDSIVLLVVQGGESNDYSLGKQKWPAVQITGDQVVVLQTDKLLYNPGQTVKLRIFTLTADFNPVREQLYHIWIEDPTGVQVKRWLNVSDEDGVAELSFKLDNEPRLGSWNVTCAAGQARKQATFRVVDYDFRYEIGYTLNSRDTKKNSSSEYRVMMPSRRGTRRGSIRQQSVLSFRNAGLPICPVCAEPVKLSSLCSSKHVYKARLVVSAAKPELLLVADLRGRDQFPSFSKTIYGSVAPECNCTLLSAANGSMLIIAHDVDLSAKARDQSVTLDLSTGNSIVFALRQSAENALQQQMKRCIRRGIPRAA